MKITAAPSILWMSLPVIAPGHHPSRMGGIPLELDAHIYHYARLTFPKYYPTFPSDIHAHLFTVFPNLWFVESKSSIVPRTPSLCFAILISSHSCSLDVKIFWFVFPFSWTVFFLSFFLFPLFSIMIDKLYIECCSNR